MKELLLSHCSGCEMPLRQGQKVVVLVRATCDPPGLTYRSMDAFHEECWEKSQHETPLEIPDGKKRRPHDAPPGPA